MAGIQLSAPRRSALLEQLLAQQQQAPQIQSVGELVARLGAQAVNQRGVNALGQQEQSQQAELAKALGAGQPTAGKAVTLEDFEGGSGRQQVNIPGKKADPMAMQEALSKLPLESQVQGMQVQMLQKQLGAPSPQDMFRMQREAAVEDREDAQAATRENTQTRVQGANARSAASIEAANKRAAEDRASRERLAKAQGGGGGVRDDKIRDAMEVNGLSRAEAVKLVDGQGRIETDDFGRSVYVDEVSGTVKELKIQPADGEAYRDSDIASKSLAELAESATGPGNVFAGLWSKAAAAGGLPVAEDVVEAQQTFGVAQNSLIRSFSLNPRFPVAEQKRILENINLEPAIFDSPDLMRARMRSMDSYLRDERARFLGDANNTELDQDTRKAQRTNAANIDHFLEILGIKEWDAKQESGFTGTGTKDDPIVIP